MIDVFAGRRLRFIPFRRSPPSFPSFSYLPVAGFASFLFAGHRLRFILFRICRSPASFHFFSPVTGLVSFFFVFAPPAPFHSFSPVAGLVSLFFVFAGRRMCACVVCMRACMQSNAMQCVHVCNGAGTPLQRETPHVGARCNGVLGGKRCWARLGLGSVRLEAVSPCGPALSPCPEISGCHILGAISIVEVHSLQ